MAMLIVNGVNMPAPSGMSAVLTDVGANIIRSASGKAVMDRRVAKRRLDLTWAHLSGAELALLLQETQGFFTVRYPDPMAGTERTMQCCCGEKTTGVLRMQDGAPVWTDVKMSWTER